MPYCSGCGSRYQEGDQVCKSCGFVLNDTAGPSNGKKGIHPRKRNPKARSSSKKKLYSPPDPSRSVLKQPDGSSPVVEPEVNRGPAEPDGISETRQLQSGVLDLAMGLEEIHLGKGIIKPKAMEWGEDGVHFKYEEQPQAVQNGELLLNGPGKPGISSLNSEFTAELPPVSSQFDTVNKENQNSVKTAGVTGSVSSFKNETKPRGGPPSGPVKDHPVTAGRDLTGEKLDALVIDSFEAELRDFETALAEVRHAETDLILELEAAEKRLEQDIAELKPNDADAVFTIQETTDRAENPAANRAPETENNLAEETILTGSVAETSTAHQSDHSRLERGLATQQSDETAIIMQGRQSWYGIPLPYYYRLSERLLVCTEPNGRIFEYELTMLKKVTMKQSWLAKLLGVGDLELDFNNRIPSRYCLAGIANPAKLRGLLEAMLHKEYNCLDG